MKIGAQFRVGSLVLSNLFTTRGQEAFLRKLFLNSGQLFQGATPVTRLYVGLCNQIPTRGTLLSDIATEPSVGFGGYARQVWDLTALTNASLREVNSLMYIRGEQLTFTCPGDPNTENFDLAVRRFFLATVATPTESQTANAVLISMSAPLPSARLLTPGDSLSVTPSWGFYN